MTLESADGRYVTREPLLPDIIYDRSALEKS